MRHLALKIAACAATLSLAPLAAQAQVTIEPQGPTCVGANNTSSTYTARVTTNYNFDLHLIVFHNNVNKHDSTTVVVQSGPYYDFSKVVSHSGWGLAVGDHLNYRGRATQTSGRQSGSYDEKDWLITVTSGTCYADRPRRHDLV